MSIGAFIQSHPCLIFPRQIAQYKARPFLTTLAHFVRPLAGERVKKAAEEIFSGLFYWALEG